MPNTNTCAKCRYMAKNRLAPGELVCKRYPPQLVSFPAGIPNSGHMKFIVQSYYPRTAQDNSCGEFVKQLEDNA